MGHTGSCSSCCKGSTSCVGEKIQHLDGTTCITDLVPKPVPVGSLFREKAGVLEAEWLQMEGQLLIMNVPLLRQIKKFPFSTASGASVIVCIRPFPAFVCAWGVPDHLRIRTDQKVVPPFFQLFPTGSVYYLIFFPVICNPHEIKPRSF